MAAEVVAQEWALKVNLVLRHRSLISDFCSSARQCPVLLISVSCGRIITLKLLVFAVSSIIVIFSADNVFDGE